MIDEFQYACLAVALTTVSCSSTPVNPEAGRDMIDLPAKSAPGGKQTNLGYERGDAPEGSNLREVVDSKNANPYYRQEGMPYAPGADGKTLSAPGDTPIGAKQYKWGWDSNSSSSASSVSPSKE